MRRKIKDSCQMVEEGETAEEESTNLETILKTAAEETIGTVKKKNQGWVVQSGV
jgi:hypothetical protein